MWDNTKNIHKLDSWSLLVAFIRGPIKSPLINPNNFDLLLQLIPFLVMFFIFVGQDVLIKITIPIVLYLLIKNIIFLLSFRYQFSKDGIRYGYGIINTQFFFIPNSRIEQTTSSSFYLEKRSSRSTISIRLRNNNHIYFYSIRDSETKNIINSDMKNNNIEQIPYDGSILNNLFSFRSSVFNYSIFITCLFYFLLSISGVFSLKDSIEQEIIEDREKINTKYFNEVIDIILKKEFSIYIKDDYLSESESIKNKLVKYNLFFFRSPTYINKSHLIKNEKLEKDIKEYIQKNRNEILKKILKKYSLEDMSNMITGTGTITVLTYIIDQDKLNAIGVYTEKHLIDINKEEYKEVISLIISQFAVYLSTEKIGFISQTFSNLNDNNKTKKEKLEYDIKGYIGEKIAPYIYPFFDFILNLFSGAISFYFAFFLFSIYFVNFILSYIVNKINLFSINEKKITLKRSIFGRNIIEYNLNKNQSIIVIKGFINSLYKIKIPSNGRRIDNKFLYLNKHQYKEIIESNFTSSIFNYNLINLNLLRFIINPQVILSCFIVFIACYISDYFNYGPFNIIVFLIVLSTILIKPTLKNLHFRNRLSLSMEKVHFEKNTGGCTHSIIIPYSDISTYGINSNKFLEIFNLSVLRIKSNNDILVRTFVLNKHSEKIKSILKKGCNKNDT